jgi:hypothetical protein
MKLQACIVLGINGVQTQKEIQLLVPSCTVRCQEILVQFASQTVPIQATACTHAEPPMLRVSVLISL